MASQPTSTCQCAMRSDHWGRSGWHFRYLTLADLPKTMTHRFDTETRKDVPLPDATLERLRESYRGKWIAVEKCPHYWNAAGSEAML